MPRPKSTQPKPHAADRERSPKACGLCGKITRLKRTECCDQRICDDEHEYVLFSYARSSCLRNHRRFTLCGFHHGEEHEGEWRECAVCQGEFEPEMYAWYGTNDYNFEKLENPPPFTPTLCANCKRRIHLATDGYSLKAGTYWCEACGPQTPQVGPKAQKKPKRGR